MKRGMTFSPERTWSRSKGAFGLDPASQPIARKPVPLSPAFSFGRLHPPSPPTKRKREVRSVRTPPRFQQAAIHITLGHPDLAPASTVTRGIHAYLLTQRLVEHLDDRNPRLLLAKRNHNHNHHRNNNNNKHDDDDHNNKNNDKQAFMKPNCIRWKDVVILRTTSLMTTSPPTPPLLHGNGSRLDHDEEGVRGIYKDTGHDDQVFLQTLLPDYGSDTRRHAHLLIRIQAMTKCMLDLRAAVASVRHRSRSDPSLVPSVTARRKSVSKTLGEWITWATAPVQVRVTHSAVLTTKTTSPMALLSPPSLSSPVVSREPNRHTSLLFPFPASPVSSRPNTMDITDSIWDTVFYQTPNKNIVVHQVSTCAPWAKPSDPNELAPLWRLVFHEITDGRVSLPNLDAYPWMVDPHCISKMAVVRPDIYPWLPDAHCISKTTTPQLDPSKKVCTLTSNANLQDLELRPSQFLGIMVRLEDLAATKMEAMFEKLFLVAPSLAILHHAGFGDKLLDAALRWKQLGEKSQSLTSLVQSAW